MKSQKGSITIFALLSMILVMTTLFTLLEASRFQYLKRLAALQTKSALESVFANYSSYYWKYYHMLGCDYDQVDEALIQIGESRYNSLTERSNLLLFQTNNVHVDAYTLLTDGRGTAYIHAVAEYMKSHILYETAKELFNQYEAVRDMMENHTLDIDMIDQAVEQLGIQETENEVRTRGSKDAAESNPLEFIQRLQKNGILELVLEDTEEISEEEFSIAKTVSHRNLKEGNQELEKTDWLDKVWMQQYCLRELSNYSTQKEGHVLSYEVEYLIGGKAEDNSNLKVVVKELLLIREVANFLYLMSDVSKQEEAGAMAMALAGGSMNPVLIETIKAGLLAAWAFGESILDVRALLTDQSVPLIKNKQIWTLELENIGELVGSDKYLIAKEGEWGLSYSDYLGILLLFQSENLLAMRSLDVQELSLQKLYGDEEIQMDHFVMRLKANVTYGYRPIFSSLSKIIPNWKYEIYTVEEFGYY